MVPPLGLFFTRIFKPYSSATCSATVRLVLHMWFNILYDYDSYCMCLVRGCPLGYYSYEYCSSHFCSGLRSNMLRILGISSILRVILNQIITTTRMRGALSSRCRALPCPATDYGTVRYRTVSPGTRTVLMYCASDCSSEYGLLAQFWLYS